MEKDDLVLTIQSLEWHHGELEIVYSFCHSLTTKRVWFLHSGGLARIIMWDKNGNRISGEFLSDFQVPRRFGCRSIHDKYMLVRLINNIIDIPDYPVWDYLDNRARLVVPEEAEFIGIQMAPDCITTPIPLQRQNGPRRALKLLLDQ